MKLTHTPNLKSPQQQAAPSTGSTSQKTATLPDITRLTAAEVEALRQNAKQASAKMDEIIKVRKA